MRARTPSFALAAALTLGAALLSPRATDGQNVPPPGNQFQAPKLWWQLGVGASSSRLSCSICDPDREAGPWADISIGAYGTPRLRVGVHGGGWTHDDDGDRETVWQAGVITHLLLRPGSAVHFLGGLGWSGYRGGEFSSDAGRMTVGVGWDLPMAEGWVVGNSLAVDAAAFGAMRNEESTVVARGVGISAIRLGVFLRQK